LSTKILYVFSGEQASGAEIVIETLMSKNMENVSPHLFISPGRFAQKLLAENKPYNIRLVNELRKLNRSKNGKFQFYLKALKNYFTISSKAIKYIKQNEIKIVHANTIVPASYLLPAVLFSKIFSPTVKWVWSDHDMVYFKKIDHFFSGLCCKLYDKTLVVSNAVKAKYGSRPKVEVLYNGLDTEYFKPDYNARFEFRKQWGIKEQTIVFAIAGIISPRKRQLELMEAFSKVKNHAIDIHLFVAGDFGPDDLQYNEKVKDLLNKLPNIRYIGHIDNMVRLYNGCDVIVNNSSAKGSEPFGATIYEGMSCETVVMAANTGGLPELVDNKINGFLFAPDNEEALVKMINYIIDNYNTLDARKKEARKKVENKFGFATIVTQYNQLICVPTETKKLLKVEGA
jgi:glycosyltransferase involved in cell wall biosynthesis